MLTKRFWLEAVDRAIRSAAQGALLAIGTRVAAPEAFVAMDMASLRGVAVAAGVAALAMAVLSLLTSIATAPIGHDKHSPAVMTDLEHQGLL